MSVDPVTAPKITCPAAAVLTVNVDDDVTITTATRRITIDLFGLVINLEGHDDDLADLVHKLNVAVMGAGQ